jgi:uncharacterized protein
MTSHPAVRTVQVIAVIPRNIVVAILHLYRAVISPLYGDVCRYYPSCSLYGLRSVQAHGVVRGMWLTTRRLVRCHPWAAGGVDDPPVREDSPYRLTRFGFIVLDRKA